jgi:hypothetical protein
VYDGQDIIPVVWVGKGEDALVDREASIVAATWMGASSQTLIKYSVAMSALI